MSLHAAEAARLLLDTAESGGSAAVVVVIGGDLGATLGRRMAFTIEAPGTDVARHGNLGSDALEDAVTQLVTDALADPRIGDGSRTAEVDGTTVELYVEIRRPVQELVIVGAGHIAQPVSVIGARLGFRVTVIDDRPDFATPERFPEAERVVRADFSDPFATVAIQDRTHILLVTRGHKYDYECLIRALRMDPLPAYIGMIGSRRRVRATYVQLLEDGIDAAALDAIHAPVGLDIGAETPEEIAVAVAAELIMVRRGGTGAALRDVARVAERFFPDSQEDDE